MAVNPNAYAVIAFSGTGPGQVLVINSVTLATSSIALATNPAPTSATLTPDGTQLFVGLVSSNDVVAIDTATNTITNTITMPFAINHLVSNNQFVYVTLQSSTIAIIDTSAYTFTTLTITGQCQQSAISPDGKFVYVPTIGGNTVAVIDTATNTFDAASPIATGAGSNPQAVMVTADSRFVYVADGNLAHIYCIQVSTQSLIATIVIASPTATTLGFAVDANNKYAYFGDPGTGNLYVITIATNTLATIATGGQPNRGVWVNDNKTWAYLSGPTATTEIVVPNAAPTSFSSINLGAYGAGFGAVSPDGKYLFVGSSFSPVAVSIIATATNSLVTQITSAGVSVEYITAQYFPGGVTPVTPSYPGAQFIPKLFVPIKGKRTLPYTTDELMADWTAIERWANAWKPPAPVRLLLPRKMTPTQQDVNANWIQFEIWTQMVHKLGAPYSPLLIPRKASTQPTDLDINFLKVQNWANRLPL